MLSSVKTSSIIKISVVVHKTSTFKEPQLLINIDRLPNKAAPFYLNAINSKTTERIFIRFFQSNSWRKFKCIVNEDFCIYLDTRTIVEYVRKSRLGALLTCSA